MTTHLFQSPVASKMYSFLEIRRALGRQADTDQKTLRYIDRFLANVLQPGQPITREIIHQWLKTIEPLSVVTRINRISTFRKFCRYLNHFDQRTHLIPRGLTPKRTRPVPYIFTDEQIRAVLAAAKRLRTRSSFLPFLISTLIGLLYSTGLRISEALKLTLGDIDLKRRLLLIRQTKFQKSRWVPISVSTAKSLRDFLERRRKSGFSTVETAPVFINPYKNANGRPYKYDRFCGVFLKILREEKIRGPKGDRGPRVHHLRHSFAVHRLAKWYREGAVISTKLPLLSTYLGHSSLVGTEVYLQATTDLLEEANRRFHDNCAFPNSQQKPKGGVHAQ
jgi:integrase/recombinase XerD